MISGMIRGQKKVKAHCILGLLRNKTSRVVALPCGVTGEYH
jgi:hypothetical protein